MGKRKVLYVVKTTWEQTEFLVGEGVAHLKN